MRRSWREGEFDGCSEKHIEKSTISFEFICNELVFGASCVIALNSRILVISINFHKLISEIHCAGIFCHPCESFFISKLLCFDWFDFSQPFQLEYLRRFVNYA